MSMFANVVVMLLYLQLARVAQSLADEMNGYQMKYVKFKANIAESSVLSLKHFYALRTVYQTVLQTVSEK